MTLPVIIASTREALAAVPRSFREACWNVGATRWQTIRAVVLPNAISGILTGVILQVSRTAGETAPILFTGAVMYKAVEKGDLLPYSLTESCMALATHLYNLATQINGAPESLQYATATVLLATVLVVNSTRDRAARLPAVAEEMVSQDVRTPGVIEVRDLRVSLRQAGGRARHLVRCQAGRDARHHRAGPVRQDLAAPCLNRTLEFTRRAPA